MPRRKPVSSLRRLSLLATADLQRDALESMVGRLSLLLLASTTNNKTTANVWNGDDDDDEEAETEGGAISVERCIRIARHYLFEAVPRALAEEELVPLWLEETIAESLKRCPKKRKKKKKIEKVVEDKTGEEMAKNRSSSGGPKCSNIHSTANYAPCVLLLQGGKSYSRGNSFVLHTLSPEIKL